MDFRYFKNVRISNSSDLKNIQTSKKKYLEIFIFLEIFNLKYLDYKNVKLQKIRI
jgi:hypothetical protein